jgi:hypothetical protein
MISHIGPYQFIGFIGWQWINWLHDMMEELTMGVHASGSDSYPKSTIFFHP